MRTIGLQYAADDSLFHYVVLGERGEVMYQGAIRANQEDLRREFRAFEPSCIAMDCCRNTRWAAELLTRLHHAVHVNARLILDEEQLTGHLAADTRSVPSEDALSRAEEHARKVRNQWLRGIDALRAASLDTAIFI